MIPLTSLLLAALALPAPAALPRDERIPILLVTGANNHWWEWTSASLARFLEESGKFAVEVTREPAKKLAEPGLGERYRALVLDYNGPRWGEAAERSFLETVRAGTGVVVIHAANNAFDGWKEYEELVALCWREGTGHGSFHTFDVAIVDRDHPITQGLEDIVGHPDELYHGLVHMHGTDYRVLATAFSSKESGGTGRDEPMATVKQYGAGRIFHTPLGHVWPGSPGQQVSHESPGFQELVIRGTEWAATGSVSAPRPPNTLSEAERAAGWELLFDGQTTRGWRAWRGEAFPAQGWVVEQGALRHLAGGGGGDLVSEREYQDFELAFEFQVAPRANSGVMVRVSEDRDATYETGPEYQVLDDLAHAGADPRTKAGALYGLYSTKPGLLRPAGEWNSGKILLIGDRLEHWLNGVKVLGCEMWSDEWSSRIAESKFASMPGFARNARGRIALQDHGDEVWYRSLRVRDLSFDASRARRLFDGRSLEGWTPYLPDGSDPSKVWSVDAEGSLVCQGNPVGYIRTDEAFDDFVLRLEWRFPPERGGNSGVLIRQIGPDQVWPRSIEAQLQSGAAGDFWNIGEFPMRADPARTSGRNTRRRSTNEGPLGEWNQYEITAWRGHVVLRVNGEILNQADSCLMTAGRICLQSEGAEIHFRAIELVPLH